MGTATSPGAPRPANIESAHMPAFLLDGKVAWVTGASRGLGRHIALALAEAGAKVALTARTEAALTHVRREIEDRGGEAVTAPASVDSADAVRRACAAVAERSGRIDVLVNNAGISPSFESSVDLSEDDWRKVIDVNLTGAFFCAQEAGRRMVSQGHGSIINVSSIHATVGHPRLAAYAASKGGLEALTRCLAVDWADKGVRVNAISPGYFETDMTEDLRRSRRWREALLENVRMGRFGIPQEIVAAVFYLASDLSSYVTGTTLTVDGGWTA